MPSLSRRLATVLVILAPAVVAGGAAHAGPSTTAPAPAIGARVKAVLTVDGLQFKDSNGNGRLDAVRGLAPRRGRRACATWSRR